VKRATMATRSTRTQGLEVVTGIAQNDRITSITVR
jgi:hypothetical protein